VVMCCESIFVVELRVVPMVSCRIRDILETIVSGGRTSQDRNQGFVMSMVVMLGDTSR